MRTNSWQAGTHIGTTQPFRGRHPMVLRLHSTSLHVLLLLLLQEDADDILADNAEDLGGEDLGGSAAHYRC